MVVWDTKEAIRTILPAVNGEGESISVAAGHPHLPPTPGYRCWTPYVLLDVRSSVGVAGLGRTGMATGDLGSNDPSTRTGESSKRRMVTSSL